MTAEENYDSIIQEAEQGEPHSMLELAKLNKAGAFGDMNIKEYLYWLKRFFYSPIIQRIIKKLDDKYAADNASPETDPSEISSNYDPFEDIYFIKEFELRNDIVEAGMALGIYYCNSSKKEELEISENCLIAALDASGWDYLQTGSSEDPKDDILSILSRVNSRIINLGYRSGEENE